MYDQELNLEEIINDDWMMEPEYDKEMALGDGWNPKEMTIKQWKTRWSILSDPIYQDEKQLDWLFTYNRDERTAQ